MLTSIIGNGSYKYLDKRHTFELCAPTYKEDNSLLKMPYHAGNVAQIAGIGSTIPSIATTFRLWVQMKQVALEHRDVEQILNILIKKGSLLVY